MALQDGCSQLITYDMAEDADLARSLLWCCLHTQSSLAAPDAPLHIRQIQLFSDLTHAYPNSTDLKL